MHKNSPNTTHNPDCSPPDTNTNTHLQLQAVQLHVLVDLKWYVAGCHASAVEKQSGRQSSKHTCACVEQTSTTVCCAGDWVL